MRRLFDMEESKTDTSNDLLIDKIIKQSEEPEQPMSLTADLLKQRQELQAKVVKEFQESENTNQETDNDDENDTTDDDSSSDMDDGDTDSSNSSSDDDGNSEGDDSDGEESKSDDKDDKEDDQEDEDEDPEDLMGSALKDDDESDDKKDDDKEEVSEESYFEPLRVIHRNYLSYLRKFSLENHAIDETSQPIVYVKESVIEALNKLLVSTDGYITNNQTFFQTAEKAVKGMNERLTVFNGFFESKKYELTNELVSDSDLLKRLSIPENSSPREMVSMLVKYVDRVNKATIGMVKNRFDLILDNYLNNEFTKVEDNDTDNEEVVYRKVLPGFKQVKLKVGNYTNYLESKVKDFEFFTLEVAKPSDLYNLPSIGVKDDTELEYLLKNIGVLLVNATTMADNVNGITSHFEDLTKTVKGLIYDVGQDKYQDLTELGLDNIVQDFIKFKIAIEVYYITYHLVIDYITGLMSVINNTVKLTEEGSDTEE